MCEQLFILLEYFLTSNKSSRPGIAVVPLARQVVQCINSVTNSRSSMRIFRCRTSSALRDATYGNVINVGSSHALEGLLSLLTRLLEIAPKKLLLDTAESRPQNRTPFNSEKGQTVTDVPSTSALPDALLRTLFCEFLMRVPTYSEELRVMMMREQHLTHAWLNSLPADLKAK